MILGIQVVVKVILVSVFLLSTILTYNQVAAKRRKCLPLLCRRCHSYVHSRWKRSATSHPSGITSHPQEDFDVNLDDDDGNQEVIFAEVEDRRLYRRPGSTADFDESNAFDDEQTEIALDNKASDEFDMNWKFVNMIAKNAFRELGEEDSRKQRDKVFQLIEKEKEASQVVTNKFLKKLQKKIDKVVVAAAQEPNSSPDSELTSKRSTESHLKKCYKILLTPCCQRVALSKSTCFLCWL